MNNNPPFNKLEDAPAGAEFGGFLREESKKTRFKSLRKWFGEHEFTEEEKLLSSFSFISGGFSTRVPEALFANNLTTLSTTVSANDIDDILEGTYSDTHRRRPDKTPEALRTFHQNINHDFSGFVSELKKRENPFSYGMSRLTPSARNGGVESFGRLAAFDWLEALVRVHGNKWLAPHSLREDYLTGSDGPPAGFKEVFGFDIGDEYTTECLVLVEKYAKDELDLPDTKRVFEIESAFCNFQKLDDSDREMMQSKC